jgi:hypothetical protein
MHSWVPRQSWGRIVWLAVRNANTEMGSIVGGKHTFLQGVAMTREADARGIARVTTMETRAALTGGPSESASRPTRQEAIELREAKATIAKLQADNAKLTSKTTRLADELKQAKAANAIQAARLQAALTEVERLALWRGERLDQFTNACGRNLGHLARHIAAKRAK